MSTTVTPDRFTTLPDEQMLPGRIHIVVMRQVAGF